MDGDFIIDLDEINDGLASAEIISLSFLIFNKALIIDTRSNRLEGPLVCVSPMVSSPQERIRILTRMRPDFPRIDTITVIPWPRSVESLVNLGVWELILSRFEAGGHLDAIQRCETILVDLKTLEKSELSAVLTGENYHTIWSASP